MVDCSIACRVKKCCPPGLECSRSNRRLRPFTIFCFVAIFFGVNLIMDKTYLQEMNIFSTYNICERLFNLLCTTNDRISLKCATCHGLLSGNLSRWNIGQLIKHYYENNARLLQGVSRGYWFSTASKCSFNVNSTNSLQSLKSMITKRNVLCSCCKMLQKAWREEIQKLDKLDAQMVKF